MSTNKNSKLINIDLINRKCVFSNLKCLSDIELYLMEECILESDKEFLSLVKNQINVEELLNYENFNFLDIDILDSVVLEGDCECKEVSCGYFDVGYGNYLPDVDSRADDCFTVDSLDLLLNYEVLGVNVNIKCRIDFKENDDSNHFLNDIEADSYIDNFIDNFILN